ncbi:acyl transferase/acyl hydrolase/lysophospholipase [Truncatella angustata]|uniref:Patatin-like phospholipase domain-containing protein n=1 Tax=Truncatella angustata TaxID=152316 RepID=A0A9P8UC24_9PEZI|nr:acyl transferase/acyl hydrolase/lysophospholipase [Truncatella angustata]KAH6645247.1 acyl transferase/acyl hydrolase/lysophospholipase [Truncatella angustata]KAH8200599.1 hypothetical protein TruAng_005251 [Truncatella angustata]
MAQLIIPAVRLSPPLTNDAASKTLPARKSKQHDSTTVEALSQALKSAKTSVRSLKGGLSQSDKNAAALLDERRQVLLARLQHAETWRQWDKAAHELDVLEGNEEWKKDSSAGDYSPALIEDRLKALDQARINCDTKTMMHLVRTALARDLGGMGNIDLYRHSHCGTKKLIERYVDSALQTINALVEQSSQPLPQGLEPKDLLDGMLYARQSFGRSALLLSGGGTFGMTHIGVLKALFEVNLLPRIISGASAGSIVCSVVCSRTDDEIPQHLEEFPYGDLAVFEEQGNEDGLMDHLRRLFTEGNWSDIKHLTRVMRNLLGDITFQEAYNRTRRICNICVSSASIYELPRLLNYVTSPNVMIWSAVAASCSVPLVFSAAPLLVKDPVTGEHSPWNPTPQMWIDGSVDNDLPMTRLAEMFNVNHFIVSQVNPHVVPFLAKDDAPFATPAAQSQTSRGESGWIYMLAQLAKDEALHRMQVMADFGIFPNLVTKLRSVLNQKYSGDINILPAMGILDLPKILSNPTTDFMHRSCLSGERATWPKLSRVRDRCAIELALDRAVHALKAHVVFSKSQADLRRMVTGTAIKPVGGSHQPLDAMDSPVASLMTSKEKMKRRHRRSSGSNLHPAPAHRRHSYAALEVTDDETDEEERLEIVSMRSRAKPKMKIKWPPNDHMKTGPLSVPYLVSSNAPNAFSFSKSPPSTDTTTLRQPVTRAFITPSATQHNQRVDTNVDMYRSGVAEDASNTSPVQTSELNELETSDPHTSDVDVNSVTGEAAEDQSVETAEPGVCLIIPQPVVTEGSS